jgi:small subunit ribosomal protein S8
MSLQSTDPIADLITRIRNAIAVGKTEIRVPASKLKVSVAEALKKAGYIEAVNIEKAAPRDTLHVVINKPTENARITEISKVSKPGRRVYVGTDEIPRVKSGRGVVLISATKGIITGSEAKKAKVGGEVLVKVY